MSLELSGMKTVSEEGQPVAQGVCGKRVCAAEELKRGDQLGRPFASFPLGLCLHQSLVFEANVLPQYKNMHCLSFQAPTPSSFIPES